MSKEYTALSLACPGSEAETSLTYLEGQRGPGGPGPVGPLATGADKERAPGIK